MHAFWALKASPDPSFPVNVFNICALCSIHAYISKLYHGRHLSLWCSRLLLSTPFGALMMNDVYPVVVCVLCTLQNVDVVSNVTGEPLVPWWDVRIGVCRWSWRCRFCPLFWAKRTSWLWRSVSGMIPTLSMILLVSLLRCWFLQTSILLRDTSISMGYKLLELLVTARLHCVEIFVAVPTAFAIFEEDWINMMGLRQAFDNHLLYEYWDVGSIFCWPGV